VPSCRPVSSPRPRRRPSGRLRCDCTRAVDGVRRVGGDEARSSRFRRATAGRSHSHGSALAGRRRARTSPRRAHRRDLGQRADASTCAPRRSADRRSAGTPSAHSVTGLSDPHRTERVHTLTVPEVHAGVSGRDQQDAKHLLPNFQKAALRWLACSPGPIARRCSTGVGALACARVRGGRTGVRARRPRPMTSFSFPREVIGAVGRIPGESARASLALSPRARPRAASARI
jgi:hypothetical protein